MSELFRKAPTESKSKQKEVQQFMNCKRSWTEEAPLNVSNFKTKPPDDEWSTPYDRALQNTIFVKKMMRALPHVGLFRKVLTETKSISYYFLL